MTYIAIDLENHNYFWDDMGCKTKEKFLKYLKSESWENDNYTLLGDMEQKYKRHIGEEVIVCYTDENKYGSQIAFKRHYYKGMAKDYLDRDCYVDLIAPINKLEVINDNN